VQAISITIEHIKLAGHEVLLVCLTSTAGDLRELLEQEREIDIAE
jgi:hypothetical protein